MLAAAAARQDAGGAAGAFSLYLRTPSGQVTAVDVPAAADVRQLKLLAAEASGIHTALFSLRHGRVELGPDSAPLCGIGISAQTEVQIVADHTPLTVQEAKQVVKRGTPADVLALLQDPRLSAAHFSGEEEEEAEGEPGRRRRPTRPKAAKGEPDRSEWFCQDWGGSRENLLNSMMSRFVTKSHEGESAADQVAMLTALLRHGLMTAEVFNMPSRAYGNHRMPYPALLCACEYSLWHVYDVLVASHLLSADHAATTWMEPRELSTQNVLVNLILRLDDTDPASRGRVAAFLGRGLVRWDYVNATVTHYRWRGSFLALAAQRGKPSMLAELLRCKLLVEPCFKDFAADFAAHEGWLQSPEGARQQAADAIAAHVFSN